MQRIRTTATRRGDVYVVNGSKMFVTNGREGNLYALVCKTDPKADPPHKGMSLFIAEKGPGITVSRDIEKIGYKGVDTVEVVFEDYHVPAANLLGGVEGHGMQHVLSGLEVGRINIASRAVGVARAAFECAIRYSQQRETFGKPICEHQAIQLKLADMATKIEAARLLVRQAAHKKDARRALRPRGRHGQAVRLGDLRRGDARGDARPRRLRLHQGVSRSSASTATPR